jgi:hypothetical protein
MLIKLREGTSFVFKHVVTPQHGTFDDPAGCANVSHCSLTLMKAVVLRRLGLLAWLGACVSGWAGTEKLALTVLSDSNGVYRNGAQYSLGWSFTNTVPIQITALGFWDYMGDGFEDNSLGGTTNVEVGLWDADQKLLAQVTVQSADPLLNVLSDQSGFRFHSLASPVTLKPGIYVLGGTTHGESYIFYPVSSASFDPAIIWLQALEAFSDTLVYPAAADPHPPVGWIGPNLTFNLASSIITNQPASVAVSAGGTANFTVGVTGDPPFTYRWAFNGTDIAGATNAALSLSSVASTNVGLYSVTVRHGTDSETSDSATLTLVGLNMFAGVVINGPVGARYDVQSTPAVGNTNWTTLTNILLTTPAYIYIDYDSPTNREKYYRAIPEP